MNQMYVIVSVYDYFAECEIEVQWASANSLAWSVDQSIDQSILLSLGRKPLFVFPLTNAQLDEEKNVVEWFGKCET